MGIFGESTKTISVRLGILSSSTRSYLNHPLALPRSSIAFTRSMNLSLVVIPTILRLSAFPEKCGVFRKAACVPLDVRDKQLVAVMEKDGFRPNSYFTGMKRIAGDMTIKA